MERVSLRIVSNVITISVLVSPMASMNHTEIHYIDNYIDNYIDPEVARLHIPNVHRTQSFDYDYYPGTLIIPIIHKRYTTLTYKIRIIKIKYILEIF